MTRETTTKMARAKGKQLEIPQGSLDELERLETKLRHGFVEVAAVLCEIKEKELYRAAGYAKFQDYCAERVHYQKSAAYAYAAAGRVMRLLDDDTARYITSEELFRPISGMQDPEQQRAVLQMAVEEAEIVNGTKIVTQEKVGEIAHRVFNFVPGKSRRKGRPNPALAAVKGGLGRLESVGMTPEKFSEIEGSLELWERVRATLAWLSKLKEIQDAQRKKALS